MSGLTSMLGGIWTYISDFLTGIFAFIPQFVYFFYTCIASIMDVLQFVLRKLAGLDGYYINNQPVEGDILIRFVNGILGIDGSYSALSTVFWSLVIFGAIVLVLGTIIAIIKAQYNYDAKKSNPMAILGKSLKAIATFALVPIVTIFGVYLSNVLLKALDSITASSATADAEVTYRNSEIKPEDVFVSYTDEWGQPTYSRFDFFGSGAPTGNASFSGIIFKAAGYGANRVRYGGYTAATAGETWSDFGIFNSSLDAQDAKVEDVASMIDFAFANNLSLKEKQTASVLKSESAMLISSFRYWQSRVWYFGTINFDDFSKYNVGLVWYFYNLWNFNFVLGFAGIIIALTFMTNIVFGMMVRLLECTALLMVLGPIVGMTPLDDGNAFKQWRKAFVGDVLMAYGAIAGMNIVFLLMPHIMSITFFTHPVPNNIMNMIFVIVMLLAVKQIVSLISNFIGGADANKEGAAIKKEAGKAALAGADKAMQAVAVGAKVAKYLPGMSAVAKGAETAIKKVNEMRVKAARAKLEQDQHANVSESIHEKIKQEEIEKREAEKETEDEEAAKANAVGEEHLEKADKANNRADKEEEAADKQAAEFKAWLKSGGQGEFAGANTEEEKEEAKRLKRIFDWENEDPESEDDEGWGMPMGEPDYDKFAENFKKTSKHTKDAASARAEAVAEHEISDEAFAEADSHKARANELEYEIDDLASRNKDKPMDGYSINKMGSDVLKFSGERLKAMGSVFGFDTLLKKMSDETKIMDTGKIILKNFAQDIGVDVSKNKKLMIKKDKEEFEQAELQRKASVRTGYTQNKQMVQAVDQLERDLRRLKSHVRDKKSK